MFKPVAVKALENYKLWVKYEDGEEGKVDLSHLAGKGVFSAWNDYQFYGIIIRMYFDEHPPPHFHAIYSEYEALININTLAIISGKLPGRALGLVM